LAHAWDKELKRPGQKPVWYLKSCRFHLAHYLEHGRSVDSPRHRHTQMLPPQSEGSAGADAWLERIVGYDDSFHSRVAAGEIISVLSARLDVVDQHILADVAEGLGVEESARKQMLPHQLVTRRRQHIRSVAIGLGFACPHLRHSPPGNQERGATRRPRL